MQPIMDDQASVDTYVSEGMPCDYKKGDDASSFVSFPSLVSWISDEAMAP